MHPRARRHRRPLAPVDPDAVHADRAVVRRGAPPGRSNTRRLGPRPTVRDRTAAGPPRSPCGAGRAPACRTCSARWLVKRRTASLSHIAPRSRDPVAEQVQAETRVVEEGEVRAGIVTFEIRLCGWFSSRAHRRFVAVLSSCAVKMVCQAFVEREVEHRIQRIPCPGAARCRANAALLQSRDGVAAPPRPRVPCPTRR